MKTLSDIDAQIAELKKQKTALSKKIEEVTADSIKAELDVFAKIPAFDETDLSDANVINFFNQTVNAKKWFGEDNFKEIGQIIKKHNKFLHNNYIEHIALYWDIAYTNRDCWYNWIARDEHCPQSSNGFSFVEVKSILDSRNSRKIFALVKEGTDTEVKNGQIKSALAYISLNGFIDSYGGVEVNLDTAKVVKPFTKTVVDYK